MPLQEPTISKRVRTLFGEQVTDWRISCGSEFGRKIVFFRQTEKEAEACASAQRKNMKRMGSAMAALTPAQIYDAATAIQRVREAGHVITLTEAVSRWLESAEAPTATGAYMLGPVWDKYFARFSEKQTRHRQTVKGTVRRFILATGIDRRLADITREKIEAYLQQFEAPKTFNNHLNAISSFFQWTVTQELLRINPAAKIERKTIGYCEPKWMKADDVERLLRSAAKLQSADRIMPRLILGFFCGMRTAEIDRADWSHVNWQDGEIRVSEPKGHTNGQKPRLVKIEPNAMAWLKCYSSDSGDVSMTAEHFMEYMNTVCSEIGTEWPPNVMRHTFATMHVGAFRDPARTAMEMGHENSERTMNAHYKGLVTQAEAARYWAIFPIAGAVADEKSGHDNHGANGGMDAGTGEARPAQAG